jgi:hypothetical protein
MVKRIQEPGSSRLTVAGDLVEVTHEEVSITQLSLDPENPRIRFQIAHGNQRKPTNAEELLEIVRAQPGYDNLQKQIRKQGGIHDPLIVRHDGRIVEGNTRFAVVSVLSKTGRIGGPQWDTVPVMRLPKNVSERTVQLLMANYHIAGKTTWRPAAQADQIYRLIKESNVSPDEVADATRMSVKKVMQYVEAYEYLINEVLPEVEGGSKVDRQEVLEKKFSHALELTTRKNLEAIRQDPVARKKVAKLIATHKIQGAQVRQLPSVMQNARVKEVLAKEGFKAASETLKKVDPTGNSKILKSIQALTATLTSMDQGDIELFRNHLDAQTILRDLSAAVENVVAFFDDQDEKRHAT